MGKEENKIEFQEMTIRIPKAVLEFLRAHEKEMGTTTEEYITYTIVDVVRADIDSGEVFVPESEQVIKDWNLNSIFLKY
jgi:hypothetical protein